MVYLQVRAGSVAVLAYFHVVDAYPELVGHRKSMESKIIIPGGFYVQGVSEGQERVPEPDGVEGNDGLHVFGIRRCAVQDGQRFLVDVLQGGIVERDVGFPGFQADGGKGYQVIVQRIEIAHVVTDPDVAVLMPGPSLVVVRIEDAPHVHVGLLAESAKERRLHGRKVLHEGRHRVVSRFSIVLTVHPGHDGVSLPALAQIRRCGECIGGGSSRFQGFVHLLSDWFSAVDAVGKLEGFHGLFALVLDGHFHILGSGQAGTGDWGCYLHERKVVRMQFMETAVVVGAGFIPVYREDVFLAGFQSCIVETAVRAGGYVDDAGHPSRSRRRIGHAGIVCSRRHLYGSFLPGHDDKIVGNDSRGVLRNLVLKGFVQAFQASFSLHVEVFVDGNFVTVGRGIVIQEHLVSGTVAPVDMHAQSDTGVLLAFKRAHFGQAGSQQGGPAGLAVLGKTCGRSRLCRFFGRKVLRFPCQDSVFPEFVGVVYLPYGQSDQEKSSCNRAKNLFHGMFFWLRSWFT